MKCRRFHFELIEDSFSNLCLSSKNVKDSVKILLELALVLTTGSLRLPLLPSWNFWEKFHQKSLWVVKIYAESGGKQARCCRRFADVLFLGRVWKVPLCTVWFVDVYAGSAWLCCRFADVYSWHGAGKYLVYLQMFNRGTVPGNAWFICRCLFVARCREMPDLFVDVKQYFYRPPTK